MAYVMRCPDCGLDLSITAERLRPLIERLAANNVPETSLRALVRYVGG